MHCLSCNYDLQNLAEHRCPECGRVFDPGDDRTFRSPDSARLRVPVNLVLLLFVGLGVGLPLLLIIIQLLIEVIWTF
ncbi:MAG: hypothetical protein IT430_08285 [Phycisphaerales bacterium]|nr:hypothetical protein [Phycisphaerales bacterium]